MTDTAQIVAIEQIGVAVLAKGKNQRDGTARDGEWQWRDAAKVEVVIVQVLPVGRSEKIARLNGRHQIRANAEYAFAILPALRAFSVAGGKVERPIGLTQSGRCPDATLRRPRAPSR